MQSNEGVGARAGDQTANGRRTPLSTAYRELEHHRRVPPGAPLAALGSGGFLLVAPDGTIETCDPVFADLAGLPPQDVAGRPIADVLACADERLLSRDNPVQSLRGRLLGPNVEVLDVTVRQFLRPGEGPDGRDRWVVLVQVPEATVAVPRQDVTRVEPATDAAELAALRACFLRTVAHDLKNPLSLITGMGHTLADRQEQLSADVRVELAEAIARQGSRLLSTLENLLALDRLALGRTRLVRSRTDVAALVEDAVTALRDEQVTVRMELTPVTAAVDRALVERIIENLARNAAEHQLSQDPVEVHLRPDPEEPSHFEIRVLDRGPGIDPGEREDIFRPYFRGDRRGVGLSIVRAFARLHGGDVAVEDRPGGGSVFVVRLPLDGDAAA